MASSVDITPLLKISNPDTLTEFIHRCVDDLISGNTTDFDSYSGDIEWTRDDFEKARIIIQNIYQGRVKTKDENFQVPELSKDIQEALDNCYRIRKQEIYQAMVKRDMIKSGVKNLVENFDWKVKWILGSSKMASLREPLVQINFHCAENNSVEFEMNAERLDYFIAELEKARSQLKT